MSSRQSGFGSTWLRGLRALLLQGLLALLSTLIIVLPVPYRPSKAFAQSAGTSVAPVPSEE